MLLGICLVWVSARDRTVSPGHQVPRSGTLPLSQWFPVSFTGFARDLKPLELGSPQGHHTSWQPPLALVPEGAVALCALCGEALGSGGADHTPP